MALVEMINNTDDFGSGWDSCPPEILLLIFEKMSVTTLTTCMFVNEKWRELVNRIVQYQNKWQDIVEAVLINKGKDFILKSKLDYKQIFYNSVLWFNLAKVQLSFMRLENINHIKKCNIYKDNLIVVTYENAQYYGCIDFKIRKIVVVKCKLLHSPSC